VPLYPACYGQQAVDDLLKWEQRDAGTCVRDSEPPCECYRYMSCCLRAALPDAFLKRLNGGGMGHFHAGMARHLPRSLPWGVGDW